MEIKGEFSNSVESVSQSVLENLGVTLSNYKEHPYLNSHFNSIRNSILVANRNFDGNIKRFVYHALSRTVEIAQMAGDNSKITIPYAVAWGIAIHDSVFETAGEDKLRYLLDSALDYPVIEYTRKTLEVARDLGFGIEDSRTLSFDRIASFVTAIIKCKGLQQKLRQKVSPQTSKETQN